MKASVVNPIGDLYSFPFQNNTNFNYGPHKDTQNILNIQPVIPFHITEDWTIITRTILPLIWQPSLQPASTVQNSSQSSVAAPVWKNFGSPEPILAWRRNV